MKIPNERQSALTPDRERGSQQGDDGDDLNAGKESGSGVDAAQLVRFFNSVTSDTVKTLQFAFSGLVIMAVLISIAVIAQVVAVLQVHQRVDAMQAPKTEQQIPQR